MREMIAKGEFRDVNHFVNVAVENQITAEQTIWGKQQLSSIPGASQNVPNHTETVTPSLDEATSIRTTRESNDEEVLGGLLWGQYYRFLPIKFSLRHLANHKEFFPQLSVFKDATCTAAEEFGKQLRKLDSVAGNKSGERISVSFPEHNDKSRRRFMDQYIGFVRSSDKKSSGMLLELRFARVFTEKRTESIGLTESGKAFAALENPVLDKHRASPIFSKSETDFIVNHLCDKLPQEALHMGVILEHLGGGKGRTDLNSSLEDFYKKYQAHDKAWTNEMINLMRAGAMSRMWELGMIEKTRKGLMVTYKGTQLGETYRPKLLSAGGH